MKRYVILTLFLILLVGLTVSVAQPSKVDDLVLQKASKGRVKVIVTLKEPAKPLFREAVSIQAQQTSIISELKSSSVKHRYFIINGFSGELSAEDIAKLEADPRVDRISYDRPMHILLTEARPQINATAVNKIQIDGNNLTGIGQTICIIDTGVNYSHESLGAVWGNKVIDGYNAITDQECSVNNSACMDDHGHGTHVSGIAAANGTVTGIAPDAKIIMIKAMDSGGTGSESDVLAGIDWCVSISNSSEHSISVISMSIGGNCGKDEVPGINCTGPWDNVTLCEQKNAVMTSAINTATAANISIIAASGNDNSTVGISSPACIGNAISVGAVDDNDEIVNDFGNGIQGTNRASILDLLAPGKSITATGINGGAHTDSGTSMSTPMVAGAAAILKQFDSSLTPQEIEYVLNSTGKQINDTGGTNLNFSRIDIYSAIISLDDTAPILDLSCEANESHRFPFNITVTSNENIINCSYSLDASTDITYMSELNNLQFLAVDISSTLGFHNIIFYCNDTANNQGSTWTNFTMTENHAPDIISYFPDTLIFSINEPDDQIFSINYTDADDDAVQINWYRDGASVSTSTSYTFPGNYTSAGIYNITVIVIDTYESDSITWILTVNNTDTIPILFKVIGNKSWYMDDSYDTNLDSYFNDADGDDLDYTSTEPDHINVSINNDTAKVIFTPEGGWEGEDTVTFYAFDPQGNNATSNEVTLEVVEHPGDGGDDTTPPGGGPSPDTDNTTEPTPTTPMPTTLETLGETEEEEGGVGTVGSDEGIATTGFAAKLGEFFSSIAENKWSKWMILIGVIAACMIGGTLYHFRMRGRIGERLEEDFEDSVKEWKGRKKKKKQTNFVDRFKELPGKVKGIFKFK